MRFHTNATLALLLGVAACGTEQVEPDVMFLSDGSSPAGTQTYLEIIFAPNAAVPRGTEYRLRVDGRWALESTENPVQVMVFTDASVMRYGDALAATPRTIELVAPSGKGALTTAPLTLSRGVGNQLVVYGDGSALRYHFFGNPPAELEAVPDGAVLVRLVNTQPDQRSIDVQSCPGQLGAYGACTTHLSELSYGQLWQAILPRDSVFLAGCASPGTWEGCLRDNLANVCSTPTGDLSRTKTATFALAAGTGYFRSHEVVGTCGYRDGI